MPQPSRNGFQLAQNLQILLQFCSERQWSLTDPIITAAAWQEEGLSLLGHSIPLHLHLPLLTPLHK